MYKNNVKKYGALMLLGAGVGIIYQLPYIRETFYVPIQEAMNLTHGQMGLLSSGYASSATITYLLGGLIADKFSIRKLLTFSFLSTGVLGLWFAEFPSFTIARLIFILMGVTTIVTYWSAQIKAVRMLGDSSEQGKLFGLNEGFRGIFNGLLVFIMTAVYARFTNDVLGTAWAIRTVAITLIVLGILHWFIIKDTEKRGDAESFGDIIRGFLKSLKLSRVWVLVAIVFFAYSLYGIIGYINTMAINLYGMTAEGGAILGGSRYIIQAFGGIIGGVTADKIGSRINVILGSAMLALFSFFIFYVTPENHSLLWLVIANFVLGMFVIYVIRSQYFAAIDDAGIPVSLTGRVSGTVSSLGFVPDIFMFTMIGNWLDQYTGKTGFDMMFLYAIAMAIGCIIFSLLLKYLISKDKKVGINVE